MSKFSKILLLTIFLVAIQSKIVGGAEFSYTFIIQIFGDRVKVVSPKAYSKEISVIIENKSLEKQIGKLINTKGETLSFVVVPPNDSISKKLSVVQGNKVIFIPLSPPFQEIELIEGKESYEIPPRQKY